MGREEWTPENDVSLCNLDNLAFVNDTQNGFIVETGITPSAALFEQDGYESMGHR